VFGALMGFLLSVFLSTGVMVFLLRDFKFWKGRGWAELGVYTFAAPMFLGMLAITLIMNFDMLSVKFFTKEISDTLAGYYLAAIILARVPYFIAGAMMIAIFPFISRYAGSGARGYSAMSLKYTVLFVLPISLAIAMIPEAFITLIFPDAYTAGAKALAIVAIGMGFLALIQVLANILQKENRRYQQLP
jgi:O-antigen/teichoic acid export membrane protein